MKYAPAAHHDLDDDDLCKAGTRVEVIDAIVRWAMGADSPTINQGTSVRSGSQAPSRILWLCGPAGAGKSTILRSCARQIDDIKRMGAYYGFDKNRPVADIASMFSTIARDLADLDNSRKKRLVDLIKDNNALRTTENCKLQFKYFIVEALRDEAAIGNTVVFIDAFDESGDAVARRNALKLLTRHASELPKGLRIVVTSRVTSPEEEDIQIALQHPLPPGVDVLHIDSLPILQTVRDVGMFMRSELDSTKGLDEKTKVEALVQKAGTSFQWAATACRLISDEEIAGASPQDQLQTILDAGEGLDGLYSTAMQKSCNISNKKAVRRLTTALGAIICAREPLTLRALASLISFESTSPLDTLQILQAILRPLSSLIGGTQSDQDPIVILHTSYRDFLCSGERSGPFFIDVNEANHRMVDGCFNIMKALLRFNICKLPTSYLTNKQQNDVDTLRRTHIPPHLSYACRMWIVHMSNATDLSQFEDRIESFLHDGLLYWIELMSLENLSPRDTLEKLSISRASTCFF